MFITIIFAVLLAVPIKSALALQILPPCTATGNCQLCDFVLGFMNILRWGFAVIGTIALLFIIVAGIQWILSQGNPDKVKKAKNRIVGVIIGLAIMLLSWQITNFLVATFTLSNAPAGTVASQQTKPSLFSLNNGTIWYNACSAATNSCAGRGDGAPCNNGGGYCITDKATRQVSCKTDRVACKFLTTDTDFTKYFQGYDCRQPADCDFNRDLGVGYCNTETGSADQHCCAQDLNSNK